MATYAEQYQLGEDPAFQRRVQIALVTAAATFIASPATTSPTLSVARSVLSNLTSADAIPPMVRETARTAVTNPTVANTAPTGGALTDAQLLTVVTAILPALAQ